MVSAEKDMEDFNWEGDGNSNGDEGNWDEMTSGTIEDLWAVWGS